MTARLYPVDDSSTPQRTLTRLDEVSQAIDAARRNAVGISVRDPDVYLLLGKPTGGSCEPRPAATFSGATPGRSAATTISTRPPTSWISSGAYGLIPPITLCRRTERSQTMAKTGREPSTAIRTV